MVAAVRRGLWPLRLYYLASFAALGAYLPYFPRWLAARGIEGIELGAIIATSPAMGLLAPPLWGMLADALGLRGAVLRVACAGSFVAFAALSLLCVLGVPLGFTALFAIVIAYAAFRSPMIMMADVVALETVKATGASYGKLRLFGSVGFLVASVAVGRLLDAKELVPLPVAMAGGLLLSLACAWTLPAKGAPPASPALEGARGLLEHRAFPFFLGATFLGQIGHSCYDLCFSLHLADLGAEGPLIGVAWALGVLVEIGLMASAKLLLDRFRAPTLCLVALIGATARWALLSGVRSLPLVLALQPLHALSFALFWVAALAYIRKAAPHHALATAQGLFSAATAAGSVVGMLCWGPLYRRSGGHVAFGVAALTALFSVVAGVVWRARSYGASPEGVTDGA